ncbi:MAG: sigma-70 family RNA polymerase sigma factor [Clostridiaceae bacterium]|jgi:DNA-directed RNA polymerase specialized sigma24 family protein|nr:sigma-70 family RNA polymerase sigma factor [Clostridiaceae bacterium]
MKFLYSVEDMEKMYGNPWLTDRERRVFDLYYRRGWRIEDIAAEIEMQRSTVDRALRSIRRKSAKML